MVDVAAAISAVSSAIGLAREINQIDVEVDKAGLKLKVAELTSALADAKLAIAGTGEALSALERQVSELKSMFRFKAENNPAARLHVRRPQGRGSSGPAILPGLRTEWPLHPSS
ncbi:hypothetical protein [Mesorhizobium sp.]|uniref:hypothetical protein n=1 Tax=Mesorhizobium sp. TaxID=1871066 RepID=UPI000FE31544|nr:hypothetical protein [Mesorhizobium sp.]RWN99367.1 MAG: hypothetical protein EOS06_18425 [Mesorhizobium sp.]